MRDHHVPCGRGEAELFVPRPAWHDVRHHETVLKDVSGFSLEGHGLGVCLNGRLIRMPCTPLLTRIGQETDNQESQSAEA